MITNRDIGEIVSIYPYNESFRNAWNSFLDKAKNATFIFHRNFMEYHLDRFRDYSLVVKNDKNNVVALFPANLTADNIVVSHQGLTYGGLVVSRDEKLVDTIVFFKEILRYLHDNGISTLIYKEIPGIYNNLPSDEMQYIFYVLKANLIRRDSCSAIRYANKLPYQKRRNAAIRNARASGIEIKEDNNFDVFWHDVLEPNLISRHGVKPVHSLDEIKLLHAQFPANIKQFNAYFEGRIMAGVTIFEMGNVTRAQYTSGSDEGRRNGSLDLLFDTIINTYSGKEYFDFGNSNENNGLFLNRGLLDWKEGLGARTYAQSFYEVNTANYILLEQLINPIDFAANPS